MIRKATVACALALATLPGGAATYWTPDTLTESITYIPASAGPHSDHLEMAGKRIAAVVRYGVRPDGTFSIDKSLVWPGFRTIPNNTHGSLMRRSAFDPVSLIHINGSQISEKVLSVTFDGILTAESDIFDGVRLHRSYFTSTEAPAFIESFTMSNYGNDAVYVEIPSSRQVLTTPAEKGVDGSYDIVAEIQGDRTCRLAPGETIAFSAVTRALRKGEKPAAVDADAEEGARRALVQSLTGSLVLETPDPVINRMFAFSKLRACESIFETKGGPLHGPGGETYYAAIWANDEAEYANPFFPFTGYAYADSSAMNSFRHFARFMNPEWNPIPSSIVAEGMDIWNGAGDRGDAAMIAYGASRYALASGSIATARELWPLIEWTLEYCRRKLSPDGVVMSDHDELEGRFPAGDANLCTSSLYYDALMSASHLSRELGHPARVGAEYRKQASRLAADIDRHFAGPVEGYDTYAYYTGNDLLRAWICIPLTVGIFDRRDATVDALFSPSLWTDNGLLTQSGTSTFWDRSTLYALRGVIHAGATERAMPYLKSFSTTRLTGDHVPYAIEAWPEGNQRHLSAESALYARIFTEGMFGIRPTGFRTFGLTPRLPAEWDNMALRGIKAFGSDFDIEIARAKSGDIHVKVTSEGRVVADRKIKDGKSLNIRL